MKSISAIIAEVDELKPNGFSNTVKLAWINELEASVQTEIWKLALTEVQIHSDVSDHVLIDDAHNRIYREYLSAMIDYANGEYDKYANTMQIYESAYVEYAKWYIRRYGSPETSEGIYVTAYGIAVKNGYKGTESEWLASLKGEKGDTGERGPKGEQGPQGEQGPPDGVGVASVEQTVTSLEDGGENQITVTLTDDTESTFFVRNGSKGSQGEQGDKGDKGDAGADGVSVVSVEQTTTGEYDNDENVITVTLSNGTQSTFVVLNGSKGEKGDTGDKGDTPTVPTKISAFTNDSGYITKAEIPRKSTYLTWDGSNKEISYYSLDIENNNVYQINVSGGWTADVSISDIIDNDSKFAEFFLMLNADSDGTITWNTLNFYGFVYNRGERLEGEVLYTTDVKAGAHLYHGYINESNGTVYITDLYEPLKTSELENDSGYITETVADEKYAAPSDIPKVPTNISAFTNDSGYITSTVQNVEFIDCLNPLESNKVYCITADAAQIVGLPAEVDVAIQNQILIYLNSTAAIEIVWGDNVIFVGNEIPDIGIGAYRIIFEFNPALERWVAGVIQDGAVN